MAWRFAQNLMKTEGLVILDTETTGLGGQDEVVQIAVIDGTGKVLLDTLVRPAKAQISQDAFQVHRITPKMVENAPLLVDLDFLDALAGRRTVAVYNADFDSRLLVQSAVANGSSGLARFFNNLRWIDVMEPYRRLWGTRQWQTLAKACYQQGVVVENAHTALGDCRMVLGLLQKLGGVDEQR